MLLKDLLPNRPIKIMVRTYDPDGNDMLFGYCHWTGTELISDDGDSYSIYDEVDKYELNAYGYDLIYWFEANWI